MSLPCPLVMISFLRRKRTTFKFRENKFFLTADIFDPAPHTTIQYVKIEFKANMLVNECILAIRSREDL